MKKLFLLIAGLLATTALFAEDYFVAGNGTPENAPWMNGKNWEPGAVENKMNAGSISFAGVPAGTYTFKVTNGSWPPAGKEWTFGNLSEEAKAAGVGEASGNIMFKLAGPSDITITFDGNVINVTSSNGFADATGVSVWTVVGTKELMGTAKDFDEKDASNDMTAQSDGTFTLVKNVYLAAQEYEYKVTADHEWVKGFPGGMYNLFLTIDEAGQYNVTFIFNPTAADDDPNKLTAAAEPTTAVEEVAADANLAVANGTISADEAFEIYNLVGQNVTAQNGQLFGTYIVKFAEAAVKVNVR